MKTKKKLRLRRGRDASLFAVALRATPHSEETSEENSEHSYLQSS
jgi:hypothetical protein